MISLSRVASLSSVLLAACLTLTGCAGTSPGNPGPGASGGDGRPGIPEGTCNRKAMGALVGSAIGGAIGAQVGDGASRNVAILVGAAAGALIGSHIGSKMDEADRACVGEQRRQHHLPRDSARAQPRHRSRLPHVRAPGSDLRRVEHQQGQCVPRKGWHVASDRVAPLHTLTAEDAEESKTIEPPRRREKQNKNKSDRTAKPPSQPRNANLTSISWHPKVSESIYLHMEVSKP